MDIWTTLVLSQLFSTYNSAMLKLLLVSVLVLVTCSSAQTSGSFQDDLLDHLEGSWEATGVVHGTPSQQRLSGAWVLRHQFFRLTQQSEERSAATQTPYEGVFYIGWDEVQKSYVAHLLNVFGGRDSETLGYGHRNGNEIQFVFKSDEGSVIQHFLWEPQTNAWRVLSTLDMPGAKPFLELSLARVP